MSARGRLESMLGDMYSTVSRGGGFCKWLRSCLLRISCVCATVNIAVQPGRRVVLIKALLHHSSPDKAPVVKALLVWTSANSFMYRILANRVSYPVSASCCICPLLVPLLFSSHSPLFDLSHLPNQGCIVGIAVLGTALCRGMAGSSCHLVLLQTTRATDRIKQVHGQCSLFQIIQCLQHHLFSCLEFLVVSWGY